MAKNILDYKVDEIDKVLYITLRGLFISHKCSVKNCSKANVRKLSLICLQCQEWREKEGS
ncbi:hypothetical protein [Peribacillus frigoritolerans]|uniref:hypothetical protein n=1 Tax=Peribacillus frigoritolerans TaxID=450367 RepID=UPI002E216355